MNEKFTLQELAELLAQRHHMEQGDADAFVKAFFILLEEAIISDKYVKVKGLGTFKLIDVEARESIDVRTGNRIEIQGHSRISFTPDVAMRDLVNKPFEYFETVVLNEHTHFDDMDVNTDTNDMEDEIVDDNDESTQEAVEDVVKEPSAASTKDEKPVSVAGEDIKLDNSIVQEEGKQLKKWYHFPWCMIASILLVGVLVGAGIVWGILSGRRYIPESVVQMILKERQDSQKIPVIKQTERTMLSPVVADSVSSEEKCDSLIPLKITAIKQPIQSHKRQDAVSKPETLADTMEYMISGTKATYTIKNGESLVRVAHKFYGNKKLWPYLAKYNKDIIKNADNVPVGTIIRIPNLIPKND